MTDIEKKALALLNVVYAERGFSSVSTASREQLADREAICRAIERHEAFKQEVSDAVEEMTGMYKADGILTKFLSRFIIDKPDPLAEAMNEVGYGCSIEVAKELREALAARGLKIVEVE